MYICIVSWKKAETCNIPYNNRINPLYAMNKNFDSTHEDMLTLLRASLQGVPATLEKAVDWHRLFLLARQHGVVTLLYDAILVLPASQQPQGDMALSWALSAERTREHYARQQKVLALLAERSLKAGLPMIIVKGMDLAQLYPVPDSRACGDIDVYFFERYEEGNALLGNAGATLEGKHSEVVVDGVMVENHLTFLDQIYHRQRLAEDYIRTTLPQATQDGMGIYHLTPMGNMVYLLMHTVGHLTAKYKMPLRNMLDWGLFLDAHRDSLDPHECQRVTRQIGMAPAFNLLTSLAAEFTGKDLSHYLLGPVRKQDRQRMWQLILEKDYLEHVPETLSFSSQLRLRIQRYRTRHWLYRYLPATRQERLSNTLRQQWHRMTR